MSTHADVRHIRNVVATSIRILTGLAPQRRHSWHVPFRCHYCFTQCDCLCGNDRFRSASERDCVYTCNSPEASLAQLAKWQTAQVFLRIPNVLIALHGLNNMGAHPERTPQFSGG